MIRVGLIGTSQWTERMYVAGLKDHPEGRITAVCGRDPERTAAFAERNGIANHTTDWRDLLDSDIDAVILSTPNNTHYPMTMHALKNSLHVLCEKPVALTYAQADAMATEAERRDVVHMTAFTYWYFPHYRYVSQLVREGYVGTPYHLNLRYYSSYGLSGDPIWRFDRRSGGEGALADIGSHALSLARAFMGDAVSVSAQLNTHVTRDGIPADHRASDSAILTLQFASGASGTVHVSMASFQPYAGGQKQAMELSGSNGTLYYHNDFATQFSLKGAQVGDTDTRELVVPESLWPSDVSRDNPRDMYGDLYTKADVMAREFVTAIRERRAPNGPDLREGAEVQKLLDAAVQSAAQDGLAVRV